MHYDALTLACVTDELKQTVVGGRVQQVVLPDAYSVGLEIYAQRRRVYLLLSAQPGAGRVHLVAGKLRRGVDQETPLLLLLRKYVRDSMVDTVEQPDPSERILYLHFEHAEHGSTRLVAEPMGRLSNLFLINAGGFILECVHRVRAGERAQRVLLPGKPYHPPPPQDRLPPQDDGRADYYARLGEVVTGKDKLWKAVTETIAGASPTLAREVAWRATGNAETPAAAAPLLAVAHALQELWAPVTTGAWQPGIIEEAGAVIGFSAYPVHFRGKFVPRSSISQALEEYYTQKETLHSTTSPAGAADGYRDGYAAQRGQVALQLRRARQRLQRQLASLAGDEPAPGEVDQLRTAAEWLLALSSRIQPDQKVLEIDLAAGDFGEGSKPEGGDSLVAIDENRLRIVLDTSKTPVEQAQQMFKRAAKLARAAKVIPARRAQLQANLEYLAQLESDLALAENQPEIAAVAEELRATGLLSAPSRLRKQAKPARSSSDLLRYYSPEGFEILVGRNARQNDLVTFKHAKADDRWLHVRDLPGSHVVIRNGGQPIAEETLALAAQLAAYYSRARGERAAEVTVTTRRFVTRVPGGHPGQVYVRNLETVTVPAELPAELHKR